MSAIRCKLGFWTTLCTVLVAQALMASGLSSQSASDIPTTTQLFALHVLPEPLVPSGSEPTQAENGALAPALNAFQKRAQSDDFSALENYLAANPTSPWRLAVCTNLGLLYYHSGYFSKCIPAFQTAWESGKNATEQRAKALADRAAGEYMKMLARLGRYPELKAFLKEVQDRQFGGQATELILAGKEGAASMEKRPEISFRCGPMALSRILANQKSPRWTDPAITDARSTMQGMSLAEVAEISRQVGLNYQPARRAPGAALILPSVIHWKVGHYAALIKKEGDRYLSQDPTFEDETWHSQKALEEETSGYFLVPPGPLPEGWTSVADEEAKTAFGKGSTTGGRSGPAPMDLLSAGSCPVPPKAPMAGYAFRLALASLQIADTPVGYDPPYGDPVRFTATYVQRDPNQPSNFNYSNLGPKWGFNWQRYITDNPSNPAAASQYGPEGAVATYSYTGLSGGVYTFAIQFDTYNQLTRPVGGLPYTLANPDGSKEIYGQSDGSTSGSRKVFLTQLIDPAGNATTLTYDAQLRVTMITDALGQQTKLAYELASDPYKITKVTDPFGRFATFFYDSLGRLIQIQDAIGIQSKFTYDGTGTFISALTTPYGTTTFSNVETGTSRRLTATDPAGDTEVLEANWGIVNAIPYSEPVAPEGMGAASQFNQYLYYRNSFHWDKKQWKEAPNDYTQAHLYHWLHDQNFSQYSPYLESEKMPLQSRIWYVYPGQSLNLAVGTQITPTAIGRVVEGGSQITFRTLNSLGRITSSTDPLGRVATYTYQPNNIDLQTVSQREAGVDKPVAVYTWNSQHRPLTYTDAAGQVTTCTWNNAGQITSVKNAKSETTAFTYYTADAAGKQRHGRLYQIDGALAGSADVVTFDYDAVGNVANVTGPDGYALSFTYDALDRLTRVTFPDGTYTETTFLTLDPQKTRDRLGRFTTYVYNSIRQLDSVTDPANRTVQYRWCKCGELQQLIDAMGRITTWKHDVAGRTTAKIYADSSTIDYAYEPLSGRLSAVTDEKGQVKIRAYNLDDSLAGITYPIAEHATPSVAFTYDTDYLRLKSMVDGIGTTAYTYHPVASGTLGAGQLASVDGPWANDTITYTYDELGRVANRSINGVAQTTSYDSAGRVATIANALGTFTYAYDGATSRLASATHSGGVKAVFTYLPKNQDRRLQRITNLTPDGITPLSVFDYTYDAVGRILTWKQQMDNAAATANTWMLGTTMRIN